jgi:hypothetical protein
LARLGVKYLFDLTGSTTGVNPMGDKPMQTDLHVAERWLMGELFKLSQQVSRQAVRRP